MKQTVLLVDTSALLAFFDSSEPAHESVTPALTRPAQVLVVSPFVVAELDCLVATRHGVDAELSVLRELGSGAWELAPWSDRLMLTCADVISSFADQEIGVTDASLVALAEQYDTLDIATLDLRHFRVLRSRDGRPFTIHP